MTFKRTVCPSPAVVEVQQKGLVAKHLDRLVVVPVHVSHEEIQHGHVHNVVQPPPLVVRRDLLHHFTVVLICDTGEGGLVVIQRVTFSDRHFRLHLWERYVYFCSVYLQ